MTPKEKAQELTNKFVTKSVFEMNDIELIEERKKAKKFALIAVDEIIDTIDWHEYETPNDQLNFWHQVKKEIEKL